jgi:Protein of unknown function (DUF3152)
MRCCVTMPSNHVRHKRRRGARVEALLLAAVVMALVGFGGFLVLRWTLSSSDNSHTATWSTQVAQAGLPSSPPDTAAMSPSPTPSPTPIYALTTKYPHSGPHTYTYANTTGPVLGTSGPIRKFRVAVESNLAKTVEMPDFLAKINGTLGDSRSWVGGGEYRLQQVPSSGSYQFTIYLVTSKTSSALCAPLYTGGYTSCRQGGRVVLNLDRWMTSVPEYVKAKVTLDVYRTYMINHEVGHALGNSHQLCPGKGKPAPVMEQQTLGLHGCKPNPWVYVNGKRYDGPLGRY